MRKWINLVESQSPEHNTTQYYLEEGCGAFAYALWVAKGKPQGGDIMLISNADGEPWYGDPDDDEPTHDFEATHAYYVETDGRSIDVMGYRSPQEMIDGFRIHANIEGPWSPDSFAHEWMGDGDDKPLYCNEKMINEALAIIRAFPDLYGLSNA